MQALNTHTHVHTHTHTNYLGNVTYNNLLFGLLGLWFRGFSILLKK